MIWLIVILLLFIFQMLTILVSEFRHPQKAVAWMTVLFVVPVVGFLMYYLLAKTYSRRKEIRTKHRAMLQEMREDRDRLARMLGEGEQVPSEMEKDSRLYKLLSNLPDAPITKCNKVEIYHDGHTTYNAILETMEQAEDHIHLEYYTFRDDEIGLRFQEVMLRKAKAGVEVRLMYDGVGSMRMSDEYIRRLEEAGVVTGCFLPTRLAITDRRLNYRNHRKIVVVDGKVGFIGGINVGIEYVGGNKRLGYWRDTHMKIIGDAVYYLQHTFIRDWFFVKNKLLNEVRYMPKHDCTGKELVQIVNSGPDAHWDTIMEVYFSAIASARERLYITTPYFIPDPAISIALRTAAASGVDVRIIIPQRPDTRIVHWASMSFLEELLEAGVRFYMYGKGFIHSKVMIVDNRMASVGTANMDMRSFFSNFEQNALLYDVHHIEELEREFLKDLEYCKEVDQKEFELRPRGKRLKELIGRLLSPLF